MGSDGGTTPVDTRGSDHVRPVREYASHVVKGCEADRITTVEPTGTGQNHVVHKVSYIDPAGVPRAVVVRVASSNRARDRDAAEREATAIRMVQRLAAPVLHDFQTDSEWFDAPVMCLDFVDGVQRAPNDWKDFEQLGSVVAPIHALPVSDVRGWLPEVPTLAGYLQARVDKIDERMPWVRDPLPMSIQDRIRRARMLVDEVVNAALAADAFAGQQGLVLLHGDVAGGNIVWAPDPVLIDWEYARLGDPADECAYIFVQHDVTEEQRAAFWRGYGQGSDPSLEHVVSRTRWWEPITILGSAMFWTQLWTQRVGADAAGVGSTSRPREQNYYQANTVQRLNRFERLLERRG